MKNFIVIYLYLFALLFISACSSSMESTNNRYKHNDDEKLAVPEKSTTSLTEDFDFTPYFLNIEDRKPDTLINVVSKKEESLWWNYPNIDNSQKIIVRQPGFRVQVLATDNLNEAQQMRSDVYFKTNKPDIYITFQAPLYKVKVGDYPTQSGANNLAFKLNQLGFPLTQVVADTVNILK